MCARDSIRSTLVVFFLVTGLLACGGGGDGTAIGTLALLPVEPGGVGGGPQVFALQVRAVRQFTGAPVEGAFVFVDHGGGTRTMATNGAGVASFDNLAPGPVTVTIRHPDAIPITIVDVNARWIELPIMGEPNTRIERTVVPIGIPNSYIGGSGWVDASFGYGSDFDVVDGGGGLVTTDPSPLELFAGENQPTAVLVHVHDPLDPMGLNVYQSYREFPFGVPGGALPFVMEPRVLRTHAGVVSVPERAIGGFDLTDPDVEVDVFGMAHMAAMGDLYVGWLDAPPTIQTRTFASFETMTGNALRLTHVPRDEVYAIAAGIDDESFPGMDRTSTQVHRAAYPALPPVFEFNDFKRPPADLAVSPSLTPTVTWTSVDAPGRSGGFTIVLLSGDAPETSWFFLVPGDTTILEVPTSPGIELTPALDYDVSVGALYVPGFDYDAWTFAQVTSTFTHSTDTRIEFLTPDL
ncbi:MAG: carboxypeptidase-like regulatory domain-containing protein [Planctomycetota bacterium]|nr:carboxypeptidase-like regulatory domain-containing protein [Planctomycetota bacterium]